MVAFESLLFCGHSAFLFRSRHFVLAIDPWLEANPACPESCKSPERIDAIVLSHGHADHAGEVVPLALKYRCPVFATFDLILALVDDGLPASQGIGMNKGGTVDIDSCRITLTHAYHSSAYDGKNGRVYAGEPCGIIVTDANGSIYHAGDTALFGDMALIKEFYHPRLAILPIGDHYTMGPVEAAYAASLLGAGTAVPMHFGTFDALKGCPDEFKAQCETRGIKTQTLKPGESLDLSLVGVAGALSG